MRTNLVTGREESGENLCVTLFRSGLAASVCDACVVACAAVLVPGGGELVQVVGLLDWCSVAAAVYSMSTRESSSCTVHL